MAQNNMNNLTTLIKRLEAATSRLEDIASSTFDQPTVLNNAPGALAASAGAAPPPAAPAADSELPASVAAFDELLETDLNDFAQLSQRLDPTVAEQAAAVVQAFKAQRQFLLLATKAKNPGNQSKAFAETLKDLQVAMGQVETLKQSCKNMDLKNHVTMVADGVGLLGWVTIEASPAKVAEELFGGAQMYGNKVLKDYKETNREHVKWVQSFYRLFKTLIAYIKEYHPKGVQWNPSGIDASEALRQIKSGGEASNGAPPAPAPPAGGAPPPPPPPPLPTFDNVPPPPPAPPAGGAGRPAADMGAVFDQLNRGEAVTSGLRKVDPSQMMHKNPALRDNSTVPERKDSTGSKGPAPPHKPKPDNMRLKKPPRKELDGNKWIIENFDSPAEPVEIEATIVQSILISHCKNTTIRVTNKANAISIDNCARTSIIVDSLVSSVDVIKCPNFAVQVLGTMPTILLDQVDGAAVYLSGESLQTEIFTSKCTSVNINVPPADEDGDYAEQPVPEQFKSYIKNGKLVSEIVEHAG